MRGSGWWPRIAASRCLQRAQFARCSTTSLRSCDKEEVSSWSHRGWGWILTAKLPRAQSAWLHDTPQRQKVRRSRTIVRRPIATKKGEPTAGPPLAFHWVHPGFLPRARGQVLRAGLPVRVSRAPAFSLRVQVPIGRLWLRRPEKGHQPIPRGFQPAPHFRCGEIRPNLREGPSLHGSGRQTGADEDGGAPTDRTRHNLISSPRQVPKCGPHGREGNLPRERVTCFEENAPTSASREAGSDPCSREKVLEEP